MKIRRRAFDISTLTLEGVCEFVVDCEHKTAPVAADGYPSIRTPNIGRGRLILDRVNRVSEETYRAWTRRKVPKEGDLILAREAPVGNVAMIPPGLKVCLGQRTVLIRPDKSIVDPNYLLYLLLGSDVQGRIKLLATGATVGHLNVKDIRGLNLPDLAPPHDQRKIGTILSSYDDLIENNSRRIRILEDFARTVFTEWFVKFRFPGYERARLVDSPVGRVPMGWRVDTIGRAFTTVLGGTPARARAEYWENGDIPWINSGKVNEFRIIDEAEFITRLGLENSSTKLMPKRTTVIAITGATLGQVSLLEIEACANQSVVGVYDNDEIYAEYAFLAIRDKIQDIINRASGGAQQHINKDVVSEYSILLPPEPFISKFNEITRPLFDLVRSLLFKNSLLQQSRDLLLPRLISGELDVGGLDIKVEDGNA